MTTSTTAAISALAGDIASTSDTDTIVILGKGPSADQVSKRVFEDAVVIGINDAERIHPADVTIFHEAGSRSPSTTTASSPRPM